MQTEGLQIDGGLVIIGGGNAALCAALSAADYYNKIIILESSPRNLRGGNSRHTRNFRVKHDAPLGVLEDAYSHNEYFEDLLKVTKGKTDEALAHMVIEESENCYHWMQAKKMHFQPSLSGTLSLARTNAFFLGGGKALLNSYYLYAENQGIKIYYEADVTALHIDGQRVREITVNYQGKNHKIQPKAVIAASGGFESNKDWLSEYWGQDAAKNFIIRGTRYNQGRVLKSLMDQNIQTVGTGDQCHAVAVDGQAPEYDGGIATRLDCVPFSIVVNKQGKRFYDEGEDVWPKRYAIWGRLVAAQPEQTAYAIIDAKSINLFMAPLFDPLHADNLQDLAQKLSLPESEFMQEVAQFNKACITQKDFNHQALDNLATVGLNINKTNWARPIDSPPYYGFPLKTGITFTYLGVKVDAHAQCSNDKGKIENLWAAGEIMAGSILGEGYLAGIGMTIGTVFGRIAGKEAAHYAANKS